MTLWFKTSIVIVKSVLHHKLLLRYLSERSEDDM